MSAGLPDLVQRFIANHIVSVEQIEILILVSDSPDRSWSVDDVFHAVQSSRRSVAERLQCMAQQGLLRAEEGTPLRYQYDPSTEQLRESVNALKDEYRVRPVKVIEAVYAVPAELRSFADAFKLRKDK